MVNQLTSRPRTLQESLLTINMDSSAADVMTVCFNLSRIVHNPHYKSANLPFGITPREANEIVGNTFSIPSKMRSDILSGKYDFAEISRIESEMPHEGPQRSLLNALRYLRDAKTKIVASVAKYQRSTKSTRTEQDPLVSRLFAITEDTSLEDVISICMQIRNTALAAAHTQFAIVISRLDDVGEETLDLLLDGEITIGDIKENYEEAYDAIVEVRGLLAALDRNTALTPQQP